MIKRYNSGGIQIFQCDNLELLRSMKDESVNLIYCDILYNTGKRFDDYDDNLGTPAEAVEWYRPRLVEMKRVLASNGSIFIHCNWRLDSYMRILMDEVFGANCYRNKIVRVHSKERGFYSNFDSQVDYIFYYVKDHTNFVYNEIHGSELKVIPLFENGFIEAKSETRYLGGESIELGERNKHWLVSQKQYDNMVKHNEVKLICGLPYRITTVVPIGNLWNEENMLDAYKRTDIAEAYDTPKPDAVLERIITMCSNEGDAVADFFMGGGTTAVMAKKLKRKGIFCDISSKACEIAIGKLEEV